MKNAGAQPETLSVLISKQAGESEGMMMIAEVRYGTHFLKSFSQVLAPHPQ